MNKASESGNGGSAAAPSIGQLPTGVRAVTFEVFQQLNRTRCEQAFPTCADWTLNDWAVALTGEVGEACNLLKKVRRGDFVNDPAKAEQARADILSELADVMTYCDLLISQLHADTATVLMGKFNEVSKRVNWQEKT